MNQPVFERSNAIATDVTALIAGTPLVRLNRIASEITGKIVPQKTVKHKMINITLLNKNPLSLDENDSNFF